MHFSPSFSMVTYNTSINTQVLFQELNRRLLKAV